MVASIWPKNMLGYICSRTLSVPRTERFPKRNLLFEIFPWEKKNYIVLNPQISKIALKAPPFCSTASFEGNGSPAIMSSTQEGWNSRVPISFRIEQYTVEKSAETPFRSASAVATISQILKKYNHLVWRTLENANDGGKFFVFHLKLKAGVTCLACKHWGQLAQWSDLIWSRHDSCKINIFYHASSSGVRPLQLSGDVLKNQYQIRTGDRTPWAPNKCHTFSFSAVVLEPSFTVSALPACSDKFYYY